MSIITRADEQKFISIVAGHPIVYNTAHTNYRNNPVKELAWKAIAKEICKDVEECKRKWRFVRDAYNRFKKNRLLAGKRTNPMKSENYRHRHLSFLDRLQNYNPIIEYPGMVNHEESIDQVEYKNVTLEDNDMHSDQNSNSNNHSDHEIDNSDINEDIKSTKNKTLKRNYAFITQKNTENKQKHRKTPNTEYRKARKSDDVVYFCRHISEVLRNLLPVLKARAKQHLNTIVSEYEIMAAQESRQDVEDTKEQEYLPD